MPASKTQSAFDVYRITKDRYANDLSGNGARLYGGRWNSKGVPVVYAGEHRSLCLLEFLVHVPPDVLPSDMSMVTIRIPGGLPLYEIL